MTPEMTVTTFIAIAGILVFQLASLAVFMNENRPGMKLLRRVSLASSVIIMITALDTIIILGQPT